jgi:plastocyanin
MRPKVQCGARFRRVLGTAALGLAIGAAAPSHAVVAGRITVMDKRDRPARDVGQAVIWLSGPVAPAPTPVEAEITTSDKELSPHVLVVPVGSSVSFPNHDPFNHNVFSLSEENPFDLGLYGRGETRSVRLIRPGIVQLYCNVHAQMSAVIVVQGTPWFTQPSSDGSFSLPSVPPGQYVLHAWHERASEITLDLSVPAGGVADLSLEMDARGYRFKPHLNKFGQPYPQQGRRY